jgi:alpha-mannosidase
VPDWTGLVGAWGQPIERTPAVWVGTHRHRRRGDDAYRFCYLWRVELEVPPGVSALELPDDPRVRLFAATLVRADRHTAAAGPLYD